MNSEPALTLGGTLIIVVGAGIALLQAFGVNITTEQQAALIAFTTAVIGVASIFIRQLVTPVGRAEEAIENAFSANPATDDMPTLKNPNPKQV